MLVGAGNAQRMEEGGRAAKTALQTAWPRSRRAVCALLAPLAPPYGSRWRLVAPPGRPETASSALGGGESKAEGVIIDSPAPGRPKPVPSIPGHGSEPLAGESQAEAAWGRSVGEGQSAVVCCRPGSSEEFGFCHGGRP